MLCTKGSCCKGARRIGARHTSCTPCAHLLRLPAGGGRHPANQHGMVRLRRRWRALPRWRQRSSPPRPSPAEPLNNIHVHWPSTPLNPLNPPSTLFLPLCLQVEGATPLSAKAEAVEVFARRAEQLGVAAGGGAAGGGPLAGRLRFALWQCDHANRVTAPALRGSRQLKVGRWVDDGIV